MEIGNQEQVILIEIFIRKLKLCLQYAYFYCSAEILQ